MAEDLEIGVDGHLGWITLNRPQAINALSRDMIARITAQLEAWRADGNVRAVLFEGKGPRGFCAGGDVRLVRGLILEGRTAEADRYFAEEYRMNGLIAGYGKPIIAIAGGAVMGGGIGIAGHARFRITLPDARYAMPEAAIGFVSDIGVNAILSKAPEARALLFLMAGVPVGPADALALGLADCLIAPDRLGEFRTNLVSAAGAGSIETAVVGLMQAGSIDPGEAVFCALADRLAGDLVAPTAREIVEDVDEAAKEDRSFAEIADILKSRSPNSLEAIVLSHRAARQLQDVERVLALDLRLARLVAQHPDFVEGVRAVLVDKDQSPRWSTEPVAMDAFRAAVSGDLKPVLTA